MEDSKKSIVKRSRLLLRIEKLLEGPMIFLGLVWLVLLIIELIIGFNHILELLSNIIWLVFIADFVLKLSLAPKKILFLKKNTLTAISLAIPALRLFRIFRFIRLFRFFRGTRLIKVISSINRGMKSLTATMGRRGFAYVLVLTIAVILAGAAGMYALELDFKGFTSYGESVWWTTMLVITVGTDYWPKTVEGKILCTLLSLYGFGVFGYITATLASFFVGSDAQSKGTPIAGAKDIEGLRIEIRELKQMIATLREADRLRE